MYERLAGDRFSWTVTRDDTGRTIVLTDHQMNRSKSFFNAGEATAERGLEHMNTLTDELCEGFWPKERVKKVKKSATEQPKEE